jgi:hypothetical protein
MMQFNLLPDVKVAFIKAKKAKRLVTVTAALSVAASLALLAIMWSATIYQKHHISDLNKDIQTYESTLIGTSDLAKILTIQNQLNSLPSLYAQRPVSSLLYGYIQATTPDKVSIIKMNVDFAESNFVIQGSADSLETVNKYIDTLKFTTYTIDDSTEKIDAFSGVVLKSFNRDSKIATFTINFNFDKNIFDSSKTVKLDVPKTITTRSETGLPGNDSGVFDTGGTN